MEMQKPGEISPVSSGGQDIQSLAPQITYSWNNVTVYAEKKQKITSRFNPLNKGKNTGPKQKLILKNVSGICRPGELLAVMGASGAGKTTLLNVLTHRNNCKVNVTGDLRVNGQVVQPDSLTANSAYVQQDDLFIGHFTVREQLVFQAMLRMDRHISKADRFQRVEEVLSELGLVKCANTMIGIPGRIKGISGGEMKRLAFACEVLTNPPLMFCDEPTSGLDSYMAQAVVAVLKNMAERGKTIIATMHQPNSEVYAMFDRLLLMAEGRVAFLGDADMAYQFFGRIGVPCPPNYNPADFFVSQLAIHPGREDGCRKAVNIICDEFDKSKEGELVRVAIKENKYTDQSQGGYDGSLDARVQRSRYKAHWLTQFSTVFWRCWLEVVRDPMLIRVRFFQVILIGILLGLIFFQQPITQSTISNINGALFLLLTNMTFQNIFGVINTFCLQIPIFLREHFNGMYRTDVYFLAKTLAELPFFLLCPAVFISIVYHMVGFGGTFYNFLIALAVIVLVSNTATSFGYMVSCVSTGLNMALALAVPGIIPLMLFGGFFLNNASTPVWLSWIRYLSWFSYGNEALNINQWQGVASIPAVNGTVRFPNGAAVLAFLRFDQGSITVDLICLVVLLVGYRVLAFLGLLAKTYHR